MTSVLSDIKDYCEEAQKIQEHILMYFDDTNAANDDDNLKKIFQEIDRQNVAKSEDLFDQFLRMISSYASNHNHSNNFYKKFFRIINEYKNVIKSNYNNEEIFTIFVHNEPILLFLLKEKIFQIDEDVDNLIKNQDHVEQFQFFFPTDKFDEQDREDGQNHSKLCKIIRSDNVNDFVEFINTNNVQLGSNISPSIFETNKFLQEHQETSILQYSAFYGSIQIFKYIVDKQIDLLTKDIWEFAFLGQNNEIIEAIIGFQIPPPNDCFQLCLFNSIKSLQNKTYEKIKEKFLPSENDNDNNMPPPKRVINIELYHAILSFNYPIIVKYITNENNTSFNDIFQASCKVGFLKIIQLFNGVNGIKINECSKHSALHKACIIGDYNLVKQLLTINEIDINQQSVTYVKDVVKQDYDGLTPLELAIRYGHNKIVQLLLSNDKIDINKISRWRGSPPLLIAAKFNNVNATKLLLARDDIKVNAQCHDEYRINNGLQLTGGRETALMIACKYNRVEIVKLLLKHPNVDTKLVDWQGKTPVECTDNLEIKSLFSEKEPH